MPLPIHKINQLKEDFSSVLPGLVVLDLQVYHSLLKPLDPSFHKGDMGHCLIVAGSDGHFGASLLCTEAALRAGSGLVTACIPPEAVIPLLCRVPEAMTIENPVDLHRYNSIGFGPGAGINQHAYNLLRECLLSMKPLVVDADGITLLSRHPDLVELLHENVVLTPHEKEFDRLTGRHNSRMERAVTQLAWVNRYKITIVLKGMGTLVITPGRSNINISGNVGMATGGSGDVLTGIMAGLLAGGYNIYDAAAISVFAHGNAGDKAAEILGERSLIASDLVKYLRL